MRNGKIAKRIMQNVRSFQTITSKQHPLGIPNSNYIPLVNQNRQSTVSDVPNMVSIYRVPSYLCQENSRAYNPNIVSIGPFHHKVPHLRRMEAIKQKFRDHLLDQNRPNEVKLETLFDAVESLKEEAEKCYSEPIELSKDEFIETMIVDGCFILQLFRESMEPQCPMIHQRMVPVLRRDLIMLENQIPMFVLHKLFDLTGVSAGNKSLEELALNFLNPLMPRDCNSLKQIAAKVGHRADHLLDLFHTSILPSNSFPRGNQKHMFRPATELREAGIKIKERKDCGALDVETKIKRYSWRLWDVLFKSAVLEIPPLRMDDYTGTLFRNLVAFEHCHQPCRSDFTTYLFFLDGIINSAKDVEILHYSAVIGHSLGSDEEVANLINNLCKEVALDDHDSYLSVESEQLYDYCNDEWTRLRAKFVHNYLSTPWAKLSAFYSFLVFIIALIFQWKEICSFLYVD